MKTRNIAAIALVAVASQTMAGPPYLTDDPVPTDTGHWEIYAFTAADGRGSTFDGDSGFDLNYGPVKDVQLTATVPLSFSHAPGEGWQSGRGDLELGVKYRFVTDESSGFSAAIFPRVILPTASHSPGEKVRVLLPLWLGKDFAGGTSIFGGGGYTINPGAGNRNFWQAAIAVTHQISRTASVGAEIARQGADVRGGSPQTSMGVGGTLQLTEHYALLLSGGPTWAEHHTGYHLYAGLGLTF